MNILLFLVSCTYLFISTSQQSLNSTSKPPPPAAISQQPSPSPPTSGNSNTSPISGNTAIGTSLCPGTEQWKDCRYPTTTSTSSGQSWSCNAGFFCLQPNQEEICLPGFFCPPNSREPIFCPERYQCATPATISRCPSGYFCPISTVHPIKCWLLPCPEGTGKVYKWYLIVIFIGFLLILTLIFARKLKYDHIRALRRKQKLYDLCLKPDQISLAFSRPASNPDGSMIKGTQRMEISVEFENICLSLPGNIQIIRNVSGSLKPGRLCAIMGPSGSGKTTLMNLLMGKLRKTSGKILINGKEDSLCTYRGYVGHVPQEDIMLRELTVRDILMHSAEMRLPRTMSHAEIRQKVSQTIAFLGLAGVMQSQIGTEERRGISGGQRKRVNIGMELVADPSLLFLDEPTSGLDSTTARDLCKLLNTITHNMGIVTAAVIHSPSESSYNQFDDLILLGKGGQVIYSGERKGAVPYFEKCGYVCGPNENPADFIMDLTLGKLGSNINSELKPSDLAECWLKYSSGKDPVERDHIVITPGFKRLNVLLETSGQEDISRQLEDEAKSFFSMNTDRKQSNALKEVFLVLFEVVGSVYQWFKDLLEDAVVKVKRKIGGSQYARDGPSSFRQFYLLFKRAQKQIYGSSSKFIFDIAVHFLTGVFISIASKDLNFISNLPSSVCNEAPFMLQDICRNPQDQMIFLGSNVALGALFAGMTASYRTFGDEKVVYWREKAAGMSGTAYFLAKFLADIPRIALASICFTLALVTFYPARAMIYDIFSLAFLLYTMAFAIGYSLSISIEKTLVSLVGTIMTIAWAILFSGVFPSLQQVHDEAGIFSFIWTISGPRWGIEALWIKEVTGRDYLDSTIPIRPYYGYDAYTMCCLILTAITIAWLLVAYLTLKLSNRQHQR